MYVRFGGIRNTKTWSKSRFLVMYVYLFSCKFILVQKDCVYVCQIIFWMYFMKDMLMMVQGTDDSIVWNQTFLK